MYELTHVVVLLGEYKPHGAPAFHIVGLLTLLYKVVLATALIFAGLAVTLVRIQALSQAIPARVGRFAAYLQVSVQISGECDACVGIFLSRRGRHQAMASAPNAASPAAAKASRKPVAVVYSWPPTATTFCARSTAATALAVEVPIDRIKVFKPLAAPVSCSGTEWMISVGSAA